MAKNYSKSWKKSKQPRKQRKFIRNAPLHIKRNFLGAHLSKELRQKLGVRSTTIRKGDKVKIVVGDYKGKLGKVEKVDLKKTRIFITGVERARKEGGKSLIPIHPSNVVIVELSLDDKKRKKSLERKKKD